MKIIVCNSEQEIAVKASSIINDQVTTNPKSVIGFATGSSPKLTYKELINSYKEGKVDWSEVTTFNLDEYIGVTPDHPKSYHYFMNDVLFNHINVKKENINLPKVDGDIEQNIKDYETKLNNNQIDIQILGIGENGHIAFNEPNTPFDSITHITQLTESTINANSRFFKDISEVPTTAITMGIKSILNAKKIILIAYGDNKAEAIKHLVESEVTPLWPCSALQTHSDVTLVLDTKAAKLLKGGE